MATLIESPQPHLTDEQFTDLLLGASPPAVRAHLESCPRCSAEAERVSGAIGAFAQQSRLWAERRAAAQPVLAPRRAPAFEWLYRPQAWAAAVLAIAAAAGIGVSLHNDRLRALRQQQVAVAQPAPAVTPATLKADNELLAAIDGELRADETAPASLYGLTATSHGVRVRAPKKVTNE